MTITGSVRFCCSSFNPSCFSTTLNTDGPGVSLSSGANSRKTPGSRRFLKQPGPQYVARSILVRPKFDNLTMDWIAPLGKAIARRYGDQHSVWMANAAVAAGSV